MNTAKNCNTVSCVKASKHQGLITVGNVIGSFLFLFFAHLGELF